MQEMKYLNCPLTYKTASSQFNSTVPGSSDIHLRVSAFASCSFPVLPPMIIVWHTQLLCDSVGAGG